MLKENFDFELHQDDLIQKQLLDEKDKDRICRDQSKALWCERFLKCLIMQKRCDNFLAYIQEEPCYKRIYCEQIKRKHAEITKKSNLTAKGNVTAYFFFP